MTEILFCLPLKSMFKCSLLAENLEVQLPPLYCTCLCDKKKQFPLTNCSSSAVTFSTLNYNGSCYLNASSLSLSASRAMNYSLYWRASTRFNRLFVNEMNGLKIKVILALQRKGKNQALSNSENSERDGGFIQYNIYSMTNRLLDWHIILVNLLSNFSTDV